MEHINALAFFPLRLIENYTLSSPSARDEKRAERKEGKIWMKGGERERERAGAKSGKYTTYT